MLRGARRLFSTHSIGMLGLPNVGKSSLWNALTSTQAAESQNFPFCTIEPNISTVSIPDPKLEELARAAQSRKVIPTQIEFVDIAGLIEGASEGKGLGNKFLSDVRGCSLLVYLGRCFQDKDVIHVDNDGINLDPSRDYHVLLTELILADLQFIEKKIQRAKKKQDDLLSTCEKCFELLADEKPVSKENVIAAFGSDSMWDDIAQLDLLTSKPMMFVANVDEESVQTGNAFSKQLQDTVPGKVVILSAIVEEAAANYGDASDQLDYLSEYGLEESGLTHIIKEAAQLLHLKKFYTVGEQEARAWRIPKMCTAVEAASKIHTDIAEGFISADVIKPETFLQCGSEAEVKKQGLVQQCGKDYLVEDGDIIHFRFKKK